MKIETNLNMDALYHVFRYRVSSRKRSRT